MVCCFEMDSRLCAIHQPFEIVSSLNSSGHLFEKLVSHSNSLSYMCKNIVILSKVWGYMYLFEKKKLSIQTAGAIFSNLRCQSVF